jgi:hypothetical protein
MVQYLLHELGQEQERLHIPKNRFADEGTLDQCQDRLLARRRSCFHCRVLEVPIQVKQLEIHLDTACSHRYCPPEAKAQWAGPS